MDLLDRPGRELAREPRGERIGAQIFPDDHRGRTRPAKLADPPRKHSMQLALADADRWIRPERIEAGTLGNLVWRGDSDV